MTKYNSFAEVSIGDKVTFPTAHSKFITDKTWTVDWKSENGFTLDLRWEEGNVCYRVYAQYDELILISKIERFQGEFSFEV